jgi:sugar phosphate isomerase/epimerase
MKWEIGLSTGIGYAHPIAEVLPCVADAGFRVIEVSTAPHHLRYDDAGAVAAAARSIREHGLRVHSLHAPFGHEVNITSPEAQQRRQAHARLTQAAEALRALGGQLYVIHPGGEDQRWVWDRQPRLALSVEGLTRVWEECRSRGLTMVVETPLPHLLGGQVEDFAWILDRLPREGVGICLDTSHTALGGSLYEVIERFGSRLVHVQASDNHGRTDDHLTPGEGHIDWARVLSALERLRYEGVFMLEVSGEGDLREHVIRASSLIGGYCPPPPGWPLETARP